MAEWKARISGFAINGAAGLVVAIFTVIASASYAALIFHGPLQAYVATGLWMALITAVVVGGLVALTSSYPGAIAIPQDRVAPILAILAGNVAAGMSSASPEQVCLVVVAAIILVTLITGFFLYSLGWLKLGNLIRYIPYPVIGGFLAGSGWLLVLGGFRVLLGRSVGLSHLNLLLDPKVLMQWAPGVLFGIILFVAFKRARHQLVMPALLVLAIAAFYIFLKVTGSSLDDVRHAGWLADFPGDTGSHQLTFFSVLKVTSWSLLFSQVNLLATILLTSVVSILLTASALELVAQQEIDLNTELRSAGMATFVAGLGGGMVGFHSLSMSRLALSMGTQSRWVGVLSSLFCGLALLFGAPLVSYVPQFVRGGLLLFLGLIFLWEWVYEASRRLNKLDYAVVLIILAVVGAVGYPQGVATGILSAIFLFVHNYSRVDVVGHAVSGASLRSNVDRPVGEVRFLRERGEQVYVLRLQGFIFFGTAASLLHEVRVRAMDSSLQSLRFVIMDFRRVTGLDSSAVFSLWKVYQLARKMDFTLLMTQVRRDILTQLEMAGLRQNQLDRFQVLQDLDHGLEHCENLLLQDSPLKQNENGEGEHLTEQLRDIWPKEVPPDRLLVYLERQHIPKGEQLIRQSEISERMYFIERGQVTARLDFEDGHSIRLRSQGPGTVVGEVGLFLGGHRTASVITEQPSTVYCLSAAALRRMREADPALALAFHQFVVCLLAERLTTASNMLREFQR